MSNYQQQNYPPESPLDRRQEYLNRHSQRSEYQGNTQRAAFEQESNMAQDQIGANQVEYTQGQVDGGSHEFTIQFNSMQGYSVYPSHEQEYANRLLQHTNIGQTVARGVDDGSVRDRSGMPVGISYEARPLTRNEHVHGQSRNIGSNDSLCTERSATPVWSEPDPMTASTHSNPPCNCRCRRVKTWTDTPRTSANQFQEGDNQYPQELVIEEEQRDGDNVVKHAGAAPRPTGAASPHGHTHFADQRAYDQANGGANNFEHHGINSSSRRARRGSGYQG